MKFTEMKRGNSDYTDLFLEDITRDDIYFMNLGGERKSDQYDPDNSMAVWVNESDGTQQIFEGFPARIGSCEESVYDEDLGEYVKTGNIRHYVKFKAYPGIRENKFTGRTYASPKATLETPKEKEIIAPDKLIRLDKARIRSVDIKFRLYFSDRNKPYAIPVIEEIYVVADESLSLSGDYLGNKHSDSNFDNEPLPFD